MRMTTVAVPAEDSADRRAGRRAGSADRRADMRAGSADMRAGSADRRAGRRPASRSMAECDVYTMLYAAVAAVRCCAEGGESAGKQRCPIP